jgi:hypothetical protein
MAHASIVPSLDADIHLVLCRFGRAGLAYIETDPAEADATTVVQNLLHGRYGQPLRVVAQAEHRPPKKSPAEAGQDTKRVENTPA